MFDEVAYAFAVIFPDVQVAAMREVPLQRGLVPSHRLRRPAVLDLHGFVHSCTAVAIALVHVASCVVEHLRELDLERRRASYRVVDRLRARDVLPVDRNLRFVDEPAGDRHLLLVVPPRKDSSREDDVVDGYPGRPPAEVVEFQDGLVASFFLRPPAPHELAYTPCEIALDFLQIAAQERVAQVVSEVF